MKSRTQKRNTPLIIILTTLLGFVVFLTLFFVAVFFLLIPYLKTNLSVEKQGILEIEDFENAIDEASILFKMDDEVIFLEEPLKVKLVIYDNDGELDALIHIYELDSSLLSKLM